MNVLGDKIPHRFLAISNGFTGEASGGPGCSQVGGMPAMAAGPFGGDLSGLPGAEAGLRSEASVHGL